MLLGCIITMLTLLIIDFHAKCGVCEKGLLNIDEAEKPLMLCCAETTVWDSAPTAWPWAVTAW